MFIRLSPMLPRLSTGSLDREARLPRFTSSTEQPVELNQRGARLLNWIDGFDRNWHYASAMEDVVEEAVGKLQSGEISSARGLETFVRKKYQVYMKAHGKIDGTYIRDERDLGFFGQERVGGDLIHYFSPRTRRYGLYVPRILKRFFQGQSMTALAQKKRGPETSYTFETGCGEKPISMSTISLSSNGRFFYYWYTEMEDYPKVYDKMDTLFQQVKALKPVIRQQGQAHEALKQVAEIHWLLCQAPRAIRGGGTVAQVMTKALLDYVGIHTSPLKPNIALELEAMTTPLDMYIEQYPSFFRTQPRLRPCSTH